MEPITTGIAALVIAAAHMLRNGTVKSVTDDVKKTFSDDEKKDKKDG